MWLGGSSTFSATPPQARFSSHTVSARSRMYGIQPIWPSLYAIVRSVYFVKTPLINQSTIEKQQLANVSVEPTAAGASADVDGIFEPLPMCMLIVTLASLQASKN